VRRLEREQTQSAGREISRTPPAPPRSRTPPLPAAWYHRYPQTKTEAVRPLECVCEAGELIFVPRGKTAPLVALAPLHFNDLSLPVVACIL